MTPHTPHPGAIALVEAATRRAAARCPACGDHLTIIRDLVTFPGYPGSRVLPCDCLTVATPATGPTP